MGKEEVKPATPEGWAVRISALIKAARHAQGLPRFPIDVVSIAKDYSLAAFPNEPITLVHGERMGAKFEGMLTPNPNAKGEWGIFYNSSITSKGRINFTLAHEFGHYLIHRQDGARQCSRSDMWARDSAEGAIEAEANRFASQILMPFDDFRIQTASFKRPTLVEFELLRDRYDVSLTAVVLKWLELTQQRAMIVVSRDGFMDWAWGSTPLFKSGVFFRARQETIPVPAASLAAMGAKTGQVELDHPPGIWNDREPVFESAVFSEYHDMTISLLIYPQDGPARRWGEQIAIKVSV